MSSRLNNLASQMPIYGTGTLQPYSPIMPELRDALSRQLRNATDTLFSARGPYNINTHIIRPAIVVEQTTPVEDYFIGIKLRVLWDGNPRSHRESDPQPGLTAYLDDLVTLRERNQGRFSGNAMGKVITIEATAGAMHSIYNTIAQKRCPNFQPMQVQVLKIAGMIERINFGPSLVS